VELKPDNRDWKLGRVWNCLEMLIVFTILVMANNADFSLK